MSLCTLRINCCSTQRSNCAKSGSKYPSVLSTTMGLRNSPNCFHVMTSSNSSKVPTPPGHAMHASARSAIKVLRSCMLGVTIKSVIPLCCHDSSIINCGITPIALPPFAKQASMVAPMSPVRPAPLMRICPRSARISPNRAAALV